jgi:regulator of replication initiation timing
MEIKINGLITIDGMKFHDVEGGFGKDKKSMLVSDIAKIHNREVKKINELINNNRNRFKDRVDIVDFLSPSERLRDFAEKNGLIGSNRTEHVYLLSERGYAKLLKIMDDDLAWEKYDELVDGYFNMREQVKKITEEEELKLKLFSDDPVVVASAHNKLVELAKKPLIEENKTLKTENTHKKEVIQGFADNIPVQKKRAILNKVVRKGGKYQERWNLLYKTYKETYHIDIKLRCENYKKKTGNKSMSVLEFADKNLGAIDELYGIAAKLFESDVKKLVQELYDVVQ